MSGDDVHLTLFLLGGQYHQNEGSVSPEYPDIEVKLYSSQNTLTIREAKTGKIIANKIFRGISDCEPLAIISQGEKSKEDYTFPNREKMESWLKNYVVK